MSVNCTDTMGKHWIKWMDGLYQLPYFITNTVIFSKYFEQCLINFTKMRKIRIFEYNTAPQ